MRENIINHSLKKNENIIFYISNLALIIFYIINFNFLKDSTYYIFFNMTTIFITSIIFIQKYKTISKKVLISNLFLLLLFSFQTFTHYTLTFIDFNHNNYYIRIIYNILISLFFIIIYKKITNIKFKKESLKTIAKIVFVSFLFSIIFITLQEYIPKTFQYQSLNLVITIKIILSSLLISFSESLIFIGFYYNILTQNDNKIENKNNKIFISIMFTLFHFINFSNLVKSSTISQYFYLLLIIYAISIFSFIFINLNLYDKKNSKINKFFNIKNKNLNFLLPILLHWFTDLFLILFFNLQIIF